MGRLQGRMYVITISGGESVTDMTGKALSSVEKWNLRSDIKWNWHSNDNESEKYVTKSNLQVKK